MLFKTKIWRKGDFHGNIVINHDKAPNEMKEWAKLIVQAGLYATMARVAAREHNVECHGGERAADIEADPDCTRYVYDEGWRVYCYQCAELADNEMKGE